MIAHLFGEVTEKLNSSAIIDVHGVGYEVILTSVDLDRFELKSAVKIYTYHALR